MHWNQLSCPTRHWSGGFAHLCQPGATWKGQILSKCCLKTNAEPRATAECTPAGGVPNNVWGWGILNVYNAVLAAQALELGAIKGLVVEAGNQNPIADVQLTFTDTTLDWPYHETSDDLGNFIHTLPSGSYDLKASHYGYLDSMISGVEISPGITTTQDVEMIPGTHMDYNGCGHGLSDW